MQVAHNTLVVVADGRKALFLRNEGDATYPDLRVEGGEEHPDPSDHDQKSDAAGRSSGAQGPAGAKATRASMGEVDYHQLEEDRFAAEIAELLKRKALAHEFETLIVVAPPRALGELRKHYHVEVTSRLAGEIDKDLTGHAIPSIEKALVAA